MMSIKRPLCWLKAALLLNLLVMSVAKNRRLPPGFLIGASTASYQIEGAWNTSGKGINTWDHMMLTQPDFTFDRQWGDVACDSYHHSDRDVEMIRELGMDYYRFSLSWPRLLPTGYIDVINPDGIRYYGSLIDKLLANGIIPMVTLFHWDLPQPLQEIGGWPSPDLPDYYIDYANLVFSLFGDRVKLWISFNEPHQYCRQSYGAGNAAPAINQTGITEYKCGHNILRAHAKVYHLYKNKFAFQNGKISITLDSEWYEPKNPEWLPDVEASIRRVEFELGWFAHPIYTPTGGYPPIMEQRVAQQSFAEGFTRSRLPSFTPEEREALIGSSDFFAFNHYITFLVEEQWDNETWPNPSRERDMAVLETQDPSWKRSNALDEFATDVKNFGPTGDIISGVYYEGIVPWGFRKVLNWIRTNYNNPPLFITENGMPDQGGLEDYDRIQYHSSYIEEMLKAIYLDNCNIIAYTAWSLMDNMEWRFGYTLKYGLYDVDFTDPARKRTPKLSAEFFRQLTKTRALPSPNEECESVAKIPVIQVADTTALIINKPCDTSLEVPVNNPVNIPENNPVINPVSNLPVSAIPTQKSLPINQPYRFGPASPQPVPQYPYPVSPPFNPRPDLWQNPRYPLPNFGQGIPPPYGMPRPDMPRSNVGANINDTGYSFYYRGISFGTGWPYLFVIHVFIVIYVLNTNQFFSF